MMGWKALKEKFKIEHIVQVTSKGICIGSPYVHELAVINVEIGNIVVHKTFPEFLERFYPALLLTSKDEIFDLIKVSDSFEDSITVFTYKGSEIIEKRCETLGWPNITHDGCLMYDNMYSTNRDLVIKWAQEDVEIGITSTERRILELKDEFRVCDDRLRTLNEHQTKLRNISGGHCGVD